MAYKIIRPRHGIKSLWNLYKSRIYKTGEMLVESPESGVGTGAVNVKFGDGVTSYETLPYAIEAPTSECVNGSKKPLTSGAGYDLRSKIDEVNAKFTEEKSYINEGMVRIIKDKVGVTHLHLYVADAVTSGAVIYTLPPDFRPKEIVNVKQWMQTDSNGNHSTVTIGISPVNGNVTANSNIHRGSIEAFYS